MKEDILQDMELRLRVLRATEDEPRSIKDLTASREEISSLIYWINAIRESTQ